MQERQEKTSLGRRTARDTGSDLPGLCVRSESQSGDWLPAGLPNEQSSSLCTRRHTRRCPMLEGQAVHLGLEEERGHPRPAKSREEAGTSRGQPRDAAIQEAPSRLVLPGVPAEPQRKEPQASGRTSMASLAGEARGASTSYPVFDSTPPAVRPERQACFSEVRDAGAHLLRFRGQRLSLQPSARADP